MTTLATILTIVTLLFSGAGLTAFAAERSTPDDLLYSVKLSSEDARIQMAGDLKRLELALDFSDRRIQEALQQYQNTSSLTIQIQSRWQTHVEQAFKVAANLPEPQLTQALEQIRLRLQEQETLIAAALGPETCPGDCDRLREMIKDQTQRVGRALLDPQNFRRENRPTLATPPGNPWTTGTPTPGSGYGPGPGPTCTGTPATFPANPTQSGPFQPTSVGPSNPEPGPSNPEPGPNNPEPGPNNPEPGPNNPEPGPNNPEPGPNNPEPSGPGQPADNDGNGGGKP